MKKTVKQFESLLDQLVALMEEKRKQQQQQQLQGPGPQRLAQLQLEIDNKAAACSTLAAGLLSKPCPGGSCCAASPAGAGAAEQRGQPASPGVETCHNPHTCAGHVQSCPRLPTPLRRVMEQPLPSCWRRRVRPDAGCRPRSGGGGSVWLRKLPACLEQHCSRCPPGADLKKAAQLVVALKDLPKWEAERRFVERHIRSMCRWPVGGQPQLQLCDRSSNIT